MIWFLRKWRFILNRLFHGDSLVEARQHWTWRCMEQATIHAMGKGMGNFKVIGKDSIYFPNNKL